MPRVVFASAFQRHVACPPADVSASTVREAVLAALAGNDVARGYVFDDRGALRKHVTIFVGGRTICDRELQSDAVGPESEVYVMQALSGG